jgi:BlaI family transcriptional regulator, penicillinase repressor
MKSRPPYRLGSLQLKVIEALWRREEATVADLHRDLGRRVDLAYVTIATVLRRMETKGLVAHRNEGRTFIYRASVAENTVRRNMASELVDRVFGGSLAALFNNLLSHREIDPQELDELERLVRVRKGKQ